MIKYQLIMLDNPIILSDEEIKEGDLFLCSNEVHQCTGVYSLKVTSYVKCKKGDCSKEICQKVIAQSHQIDWDGLESDFGYVDIEKLIKSEYPVDEISFKRGFKKAQELTDKKFSLEEVFEACSLSIGMYSPKYACFDENWKREVENHLNSLPKYKSFRIEVEMEGCSDCHLNEGYMNSPNCCRNIKIKVTNGKIKITKKL